MNQRCEKHGRIFASYEFCTDCLREEEKSKGCAMQMPAGNMTKEEWGDRQQGKPIGITTTLPTAEQVCAALRRKWAHGKTSIDPDCLQAAELITAQAADIERLTKELDVATSVHRWSVEERHGGTLSVCRNNHGKGEPCEWEIFVPSARAETAEASLAAVTAERDAMWDALQWYGENSRLARLIHSEGDVGRNAIAADGGSRARAALSTDAQVEGKHCRHCGSERKSDTCWKCGSELFVVADGWEEPSIPPIGPIRKLAREVGYAIGVHGSQERDLDLIAAPWTDDALQAEDLLRHIAQGINAHIVSTEQKPLGRFSATLQIDGWFKSIDISVCPRVPLDAQGEK